LDVRDLIMIELESPCAACSPFLIGDTYTV